MPDLLTDKTLVNAAIITRDSFTANVYLNTYMVAANHLPFPDDGNPPAPDNSEFFQSYDMPRKIIFGKKLEAADVALVTKYYAWTSGEVYAAYDDRDPDLNVKKFYCISQEGSEYSVFKCLFNAKGSPSLYQPKKSETHIEDELYRTNDGYIWKLLYTVQQTEVSKFAVTGSLFPVFENPAANTAAVEGALHAVITESGGSGYNSYISGSFRTINVNGNTSIHAVQSDNVLSANTDYYKFCGIHIKAGTGMGQLRQIEEYIVTGSDRRIVLKEPFSIPPDYSSKFDIAPFVRITGDGVGAEAVPTINATSNTIHSISMINVGRNYTVADVEIVANPAVLTSNNAICRAIISPQGGHGSDIPTELFAKAVVFSTDFVGTENDNFPVTNDYRTTALFLNPIFANTVLTVDSVAGFQVGQTVVQQTGLVATVSGVNLDGDMTIRLGGILGTVQVGAPVIAMNMSTGTPITMAGVTATDRDLRFFDNRSAYAVEAVSPLNEFIQDEKITQTITGAYGHLHSIDGNVMYLTGVVGSFSVSDFTIGFEAYLQGETSGAIAKINGYNPPDLIKTRGKCLYINTTTPIERSEDQAERLKLVIGY